MLTNGAAVGAFVVVLPSDDPPVWHTVAVRAVVSGRQIATVAAMKTLIEVGDKDLAVMALHSLFRPHISTRFAPALGIVGMRWLGRAPAAVLIRRAPKAVASRPLPQ
jgi:hypothetical protein